MQEPPDDTHAEAADVLVAIWLMDGVLAERVTEMPWLVDGVSEVEVVALSHLAALADSDLVLVRNVAGLLWLADDVTEEESVVLSLLRDFAARRLALARTVAKLPWLTDDLSEAEFGAIVSLGSLATGDVALAITVAGLPSMADELSTDEASAIDHVSSLAQTDLGLARAVVSFAWRVDDLVLARTVAELLWEADSVAKDESFVLSFLSSLALTDAALVLSLAKLPWLADGVSTDEADVSRSLTSLAEHDAALARTVAELPWLIDGVTKVEEWAVRMLAGLSEKDRVLARSILEIPWVTDGVSGAERRAFDSMVSLAYAGRFDEVTQAPWYADGLNDGDMALLATLYHLSHRLPTLYDALLDSYDARKKSIFLPLAGEVRLWAFDPCPFPEDEDALRMMEDVVRAAEAFMSEPFPASDVIMVTSNATKFGGGAWKSGGFVFVARHMQLLWDPTVYHEVGHYYFHGRIGPSWLVEGGATFIEALTRDAIGVETLEERRRHVWSGMEQTCHADDLNNIQQLNALQALLTTELHICNYVMGSHFLIMLTLTLGEEAISSALRDLYVKHRPVTEEEIYRAFLKHTPPELVSEFRALYRQLHGGTYDDAG